MRKQAQDERLLRYYLLGELPEDEAISLEARLAEDQRLRDEVSAAERDLIDEYVRGRLTADERGRFEKLFFTSEQRQRKISFGRALVRVVEAAAPAPVSPKAAARTPARRWAHAFLHLPRWGLGYAAALALLAIGFGIWFVAQKERTNRQVAQANAVTQPGGEISASTPQASQVETPIQPTPTPESAPTADAQPPRDKRSRPAPSVATFLLLPGSVRSEDVAEALHIPVGSRVVRLRLHLESVDAAHVFDAFVSSGGMEVLRRTNLRALSTRQGRAVAFDVPARLLSSGRRYEITLSDSRDPSVPLNLYRFSVREK
jgi:anti-sigma factor RsiW